MIVDTHCHVSAGWYEPCDVLLHQMDRNGVERAWLVQLLNTYDNAYQQQWARTHPDRLVSVVGIDWTDLGAIETLEQLAQDGAHGVRLRPGSRSPGDDPLAIWRAAEQCKLVVSCVGTAAQFADPAFTEVIGACPTLPIVLEHLGGLARPDVGDVTSATPRIADLARHANLFLKMPGLGQIYDRAALARRNADPAPPLAAMIAAFGPARLMWGSDFPVVSTREGYANALAWTRDALPAGLHDAIFGDVAIAVMGKHAR